MTAVTIHQAKNSLSKLVAAVEEGEEVVVFRGQVPVARLVPYRKAAPARPKLGAITSKPVKLKPGCFAPLSDEEMAAWSMA